MPTSNQQSTQARAYLDAALLQSVAESYLHLANEFAASPWHFVPNGQQSRELRFVLNRGSNHPNRNAGGDGATGLTATQYDYFSANYEVVMHYPNDASGFSATLFRNKSTNEYTLSFRSTEYAYATLGGDWALDGKPGADGDIGNHGFALAQLSAMEEVYAQLTLGNVFEVTNDETGEGHWVEGGFAGLGQGNALTVTGYSLGGHMATTFAIMHPEVQAYTFNAAGVGTINGQPPYAGGIAELIRFYDEMMAWDGTPGSMPTSALFPEFPQLLSQYLAWHASPNGPPPSFDFHAFMGVVSDSAAPYQLKYDALLELLDSHIGGTIGIGLEQQADALGNYAGSNLDPSQLLTTIGEMPWSNIHQMFGHGAFFDPQIVANSGWHGPSMSIGVEDLPMSRGFGFLEYLGPDWWESFRSHVGEYGDTHSITPLIDSLTIIDMFQRLDSSFEIADFAGLLATAANRTETIDMPILGVDQANGLLSLLSRSIAPDKLYDSDALENVVNAMSRLFLGDAIADVVGDYDNINGFADRDLRNNMHVRIAAILASPGFVAAAAADMRILDLSDLSASEIADRAANDLAFRYALLNGDSFVVTGLNTQALYAQHNTQGELDDLTDAFIADRARFLEIKLDYDGGREDENDGLWRESVLLALGSPSPLSGAIAVALGARLGDKPYTEAWDDSSVQGNWEYIDYSGDTEDAEDTEVRFTIDGSPELLEIRNHVIAFANAEGSALEGGALSDRLYGAAGDDTLTGFDGDDRLEGGGGNDLLIGGEGTNELRGGDGADRYVVGVGRDIVIDSNHQGEVWWGAASELDGGFLVRGSGGVANAAQNWVQLSATSWMDREHNVTYTQITAWDGSIRLQVLAPDRTDGISAVWIEDFHEGDLGISLAAAALPGPTGLIAEHDENGDWHLGEDDEQVVGTSEREEIYSGGGIDWVEAGLGRDQVLGGAGNDFLFANAWRDPAASAGGNPAGASGSGLNRRGAAGAMAMAVEDDGAGDLLSGDSGDDLLVGERGGDLLLGGAGRDVIHGDAGDDHIYGDAHGGGTALGENTGGVETPMWEVNRNVVQQNGSDYYMANLVNVSLYISANGDADVILAGAGSDWVNGMAGNDYIDGGIGDDLIFGDEGADTLLGGDGNDVLHGGGSMSENAAGGLETGGNVGDAGDFIDGGAGDDVLIGALGNDVLEGGSGADHLNGGEGVDSLRGGTGEDTMLGGAGNDMLSGDADNDVLIGGAGNDVVLGGDGDDELQGDAADLDAAEHGDDAIDGGAGNDLLFGFDGNDALSGGDGDDEITAGEGNDALDGGAGADLLIGDAGDDDIVGGGDNDQLAGGDGDDTLAGGTGDDLLVGDDGDDTLDGGAGNDALGGGAGADILNGGEGIDNLEGGAGADVINGGAGADYIVAGDGDDTIIGGDGADTLIGGGGNDILDGGAGNDIIFGGGGNDQYVWTATSGNDRIRGLDAGDAIVKFGADVDKADIEMWKFGEDLVIKRRTDSGSSQLVIENFGSGLTSLNAFEFADGTRWTTAEVLAVLNTGDSSDNLIHGYQIDESIAGFAGNDQLRGGGGNDTVDGGSGNDRLYGESGDDTLSAGEDGDYVYGGDGNDVISGGTGNDIITGGTGSNVYLFERGDGLDQITLESASDRLRFASGIDASQLSMARSGDDLLIEISGSTDQVRILNQFANGSGLIAIEFAGGGTALTAADIALLAEGGGTANTQTGTAGDDVYAVDHPDDMISEQAGGGIDTVNATTDYVLPDQVERLNLLGSFGWRGTGNALDNTIYGNAGSNWIDGAGGIDTAHGGAGDDHYVNIESVVEAVGGGYDTFYITHYAATLAANVEHMIVNSNSWSYTNPDRYTGNALDNVIDVQSNRAALIINGGAGADRMIYSGRESVTFIIDNVGDTWSAHNSLGTVSIESSVSGEVLMNARVDNYTATSAANVQLTGNARSNRIDLIAAVAGSAVAGGAGNDTYVLDEATTVVELADGGTDRIEFVGINGHVTLAEHVESLTLRIEAQAASGTGNAGNNTLIGNFYNNTLHGDAGDDKLFGGDGNDVLDGGSGSDQLNGGNGSDTYFVDSAGDVVIENGTDSFSADVVHSSVDYVLGSNLDSLFLSGSATIGTGNDQGNIIRGTALSNTITGALDDDVLQGGAGDDTYVYNLGDGSDRIEELVGEGIDTLRLGVGIEAAAVTLVRESGRILLRIGSAVIDLSNPMGAAASGVEFIEFANGERWDVLALTQPDNPPFVVNGIDAVSALGGQAFQFVVPANIFEDEAPAQLQYSVGASGIPSWMTFNAQTRTFSGTPPMGVGSDYLIDLIATDAAGQSASIMFELRLRNPVLGTAAVNNLVGTTVRDAIFGYAGNDVLDGRAGADELYGGTGNDTYVVDSEEDIVFELAGEGVDLVQSSVHFGLHEQVENLTLTGSAALDGYGNELDNVLTGNSGANVLDGWYGNDTLVGGAGNDTMIGGEGNDIYTVTEAGDVVTEYANEGTDTVRSSRTYTLGADVENLELTGTAANSGTGNALANQLTGTSGNNTLSGLDGADVLIGAAGTDTLNGGNGADRLEGGTGTDTLNGGEGNDTYVMGRGDGVDTVVETGVPGTNQDTVLLKPGVTYDQLWFRRPSGSNNLEILIIGTSDKIVIKNWYVGVNNRTELFRTESGNMALTADKVQALVTAMAALPTPSTGQTTLPASTRTQLNAVFASTWAPYSPPPQLAGDSDVAVAEISVPLAVAKPLLLGDPKRPLHDASLDPGATNAGIEVPASLAKPVSRYGIKDPTLQPFDLVPETEVPEPGVSLAKPIRNEGIDKPILLPIGPVEEELAFEQATATANDMLTRLLQGRNLSNDSSLDAASSARPARRSLVEDSIDFEDALFHGKPVDRHDWAARQWQRADVETAAAANQVEAMIAAMAAFAPRPSAELLPSEHDRHHVQPVITANPF